MYRLNFEQIFERGVTDNGMAEEQGGTSCFGKGQNRQIRGEELKMFRRAIMLGESTDLSVAKFSERTSYDKQLLLSLFLKVREVNE